MNQNQNTKKALRGSLTALFLCIVMLIGTTFAWFTDSVASGTNVIQSGNLDVELEYSKDGQDWKNADGATDMFAENAVWEPGHTEVVYLKVNNAGNLALKYKLGVNVVKTVLGKTADGKDIDLSKFLKFGIAETDAVYTDRAAAQAAVKDSATLVSDGYASEEKILTKGASSNMLAMVVYMPEDTGNDANHNGTDIPSIEMGVKLAATQTPHESDSFGPDYDAEAETPEIVSTESELIAAAEKGGTVKLADSITASDNLIFAEDAVLDMNGQTLTVNGGEGSVKSQKGTTLVVKGSGTLKGALYADGQFGIGSTIIVNANDGFTVQSYSDNGWAVYGVSGSSIEINGGTYNTAADKGTSGVIHTLGASLTVRNATINVGPDSVMNAYGIYSSAKENLIENVTVNAKYSIAVNLNNSSGKTTINGGTFITENIAEGWNPNPTIRYQGELNISGASITRVGVGVQCATLDTTEVTGLTIKDCEFTPVNGGEQYADTAHK